MARTKIAAFAISGFAGGVGGALYALWAGTVGVKSLDVWVSVMVLCCIVLGGMGSLSGVVLGTAILMSLGEVLRMEIGGFSIPPEARFLVYGFLLIVVMRFRPQGLLPPDRRIAPIDADGRERLLAGDSGLYALDSGSDS